MVTAEQMKNIHGQLRQFAKMSKDIKIIRSNWIDKDWKDTLYIKPTEKNCALIVQIIDFLSRYDWGYCSDTSPLKFFKEDKIFYHSVSSRTIKCARKFNLPHYDVNLIFEKK